MYYYLYAVLVYFETKHIADKYRKNKQNINNILFIMKKDYISPELAIWKMTSSVNIMQLSGTATAPGVGEDPSGANFQNY